MWRRLFTEEDRQRLGNDLEESYSQLRTVGMWQQARGVSGERAIIEVARGVNSMSPETADWLLRELGEVDHAPMPDRPVWDMRTGELRFAGNVIRRLRVMRQPSNIQRILDAFQSAGWPVAVSNPLGNDQHQLSLTLYHLNRRLEAIRFHSVEGGRSVRWRRT
jgi:hypothetical protein